MSDRILTRGNVVTAFLYGLGDSRAECSCGYDGPSRIRAGRAKLDALMHAAESGCLPDAPLTCRVGDRPSLWRRLTPPSVIAAMPLLLIPAGMVLAPWLQLVVAA